MRKEQKTVAIGAASGVTCMALSVLFLYTLFPEVPGMGTVLERISFALQMNVFAVIPLFLMLITVGNSRFLSDAIDPTRYAESKLMEIDGRVADNTLQQNVVFLIGTLALATLIPAEMTKLFAALATVFVLARIAFWAGYRKNPLYRAPGMAATAYMNLGILLSCVYLIFT